MIAFLVSLLLAQSGPPSPPPAPATPAPAATRIRIGAPEPAGTPAAGPNDAVIRNSGSTNTTGYTIVVHPDATADLTQNGTTLAKPVGKAQADALFTKLAAAGPLAALPRARCMRSASFGSVTTVTYRGETSGDLGCADDPRVTDLQSAAAAIVNQVGATAPGSHLRRPL